MKKIYNAPELEIVKVDTVVDILTSSVCPADDCNLDTDESIGICYFDDNDVPA